MKANFALGFELKSSVKVVDPILIFINDLCERGFDLSSGNCGMLAIALHEKFAMDEFVFVENDVEPGKLYHVAAIKGSQIYDVDGVTSMFEVKRRGFDDDFPLSKPKTLKVKASSDFYHYIQVGTDPKVTVGELISLDQSETIRQPQRIRS